MYTQNRFLLFLFTTALWFLAACQPITADTATAVVDVVAATETPTSTAQPTETAVAEVIEVTPQTETAVATPTTIVLAQPTETAVAEPTIEPTSATAADTPIVTDELEASLVLQVGGSPQAVSIVGDIAYLAVGTRLVLVDVSNPTAPQLIAESSSLNDVLYDIAVVDNMVYAAAGRSGLAVFDVSEPTSIEIVNSGPSYPGANPAGADSVLVADGFAFVRDINWDNGHVRLLHFDLSQPTQPTLLATVNVPNYSNIDIYGDILAVFNSGKIDLRHTADPSVTVSAIQLAQYTYATQIVFVDDLLYVTTAGPKLVRVYDISNLAEPQQVSGDNNIEDLLYASYSALANGHMFIGGTFGEFGYCSSKMWIIDVQQLAHVQQIATFDPHNCMTDLTAVGDILYATGRSGLQLFDVSNPAQPQLLSTVKDVSGIQNVLNLAAKGQYVYVMTSEGHGSALQTVDISQPMSPLVGEALPIPGSGGSLFDLYITNNTLIIPVMESGIHTLDISQPTAPTFTYNNTEEVEYFSYSYPTALASNVLYEPTVPGGAIAAIDLTNPAKPIVPNKFQLSGSPGRIVTDDNYLYALSYQFGDVEIPGQFEIFSLADPLFPERVGTLEWLPASMRPTVVDQTVVIGCFDGGCRSLYLVDVTDVTNPTLVQEVTLPFAIQQLLSGENGRLYIITPKGELYRMDVSNPQQLTAVTNFQLPAHYKSIKIVGDLLYIAGNDAGLSIFQLPE